MAATRVYKGDVVSLPVVTWVACGRGLSRRYEAGAQFVALNGSAGGRFAATDAGGRRVELTVGQVVAVEADPEWEAEQRAATPVVDDDQDATDDPDGDDAGLRWHLDRHPLEPRRRHRRPDLPRTPTVGELVAAGVLCPLAAMAR
jgi:hypothetical protein